MMHITIYGTGCNRQLVMEAKVREAARQARIPIHVQVIQDLDVLLRRRVSHTPALELDGRLVISGRVPFLAELLELFNEGKVKAVRQFEFAPIHVTSINPPTAKTHAPVREMDVALRYENAEAMKTPITWIVGLDFSSMDRAVVEYTASLAELLTPEKIYFLHVYPNLDLPDAARAALEQPDTPLDERLRQDMVSLVEDAFPDAIRYQAECQVVEGKPERQLLRWSHIKAADLLIMGRKRHPGDSGVIPKRVARKAACSVLFVPERPRFSLQTLLVPTDFSAPSAKALQTAKWIAGHTPQSETFLFHSCHLPSSVYYDGMAGSSMVDLLQEAAEEQMAEFKEKYQAPEARVMVDAKTDRSVARTLADTARAIPADLVIIGGSGRSGLTGALIGSVTESLLQALDDTPIWVAKEVHRTHSTQNDTHSAIETRA